MLRQPDGGGVSDLTAKPDVPPDDADKGDKHHVLFLK